MPHATCSRRIAFDLCNTTGALAFSLLISLACPVTSADLTCAPPNKEDLVCR